MNFPLPVIQPIENEIVEIWQSVYEPSRGTSSDKTTEESLWRRTQDKRNRAQSGWKSEHDNRRKLFYYQYNYDLLKDDNNIPYIGLMSAYIYVSLSLPHDEILQYSEIMLSSAKKGGWELEEESNSNWSGQIGDLLFQASVFKPSASNILDSSQLPDTYSSLELTFRSSNFIIDEDVLKKPWTVLASGMRNKLTPGNPTVTFDLSTILEYLPAQLEIGCGPAFEAGVPALHDLHYLYSINDPFTKHFILNPKEDKFLIHLFENPAETFHEGVSIFRKMITAPITLFYRTIAELYKEGFLVGPIITNNFDGIHLRLGIPEVFVRRYEDNNIMPSVSFHPDAKSLLVVGCHADRRGIQEQARENGIKVIVIDPEGWYVGDQFIKYPLEAQHDDDIVINNTAGEGILQLLKLIRERGITIGRAT